MTMLKERFNLSPSGLLFLVSFVRYAEKRKGVLHNAFHGKHVVYRSKLSSCN